jgi:protein disulfide-isomerase
MSKTKHFQTLGAIAIAFLVVAAGCASQFKNGLRSFLPKEQLFSNEGADLLDRNERGTQAKTAVDDSQKNNVDYASYEGEPDEGANARWIESFEDAVNESKRTGKPILANFTGSDWCGFCVKLKQEVFSTPQFKNWASEKVVLLELDFPRSTEQPPWLKQQNKRLKDRYQIRGYPTVLILSSTGSVMEKLSYMNDADKWIAVANNSIATYKSLRSAEFIDAADMKSDR